MASGVHFRSKARRRPPTPLLAGLALATASCVPAAASDGPLAFASADVPAGVITAAPVPTAVVPTPGATTYAFDGRTPLDNLRAQDCLAQAIYYEAGSESEEGQRAVAQVVLNRVRHPAWPDSVCGVVYQGPMREGGGCQFTFTCDGSLSRRPGGPAWARARALAAEALAGYVYAPAATSTHYHTFQVSPPWAPALQRTIAIGAHLFYRLPGRWGDRTAFAAVYSGSEPMPRPSMLLPRARPLPAELAALIDPPRTEAAVRAAVAPRSDIPADPRWTAIALPDSRVRDEFRNSGQWRADAPAAIAGR